MEAEPILPDLGWYAKRLRVMSLPEVIHRIGEQVAIRTLQVRQRVQGDRFPAGAYPPDRYAFCAGRTPRIPEPGWDLSGLREEADSLLAGSMEVLGSAWRWERDDSVWHRAPDTRRVWPFVFSGAVPYRRGNPFGDARAAWEPARLQQLVTLALIARNSEPKTSDQAVSLMEEILLSWVRANPWMRGIHYVSAMEAGLRVISACHAVDMVRTRLHSPRVVWPALLSLVAGHAHMIANRISRHSSAGNHSIAEGAALVYAGTLFPEMRGAGSWKKTGERVLEREVPRQVLSDGGGIERSFWYHLFVLDLAGLVIRLLRRAGGRVPAGLEESSVRGRAFLNAFSDRPGSLPPIGDGDNGYALSRRLRISWNNEPKGAGLRCFEETGTSLIRAEDPGRTELIFDHGPLGMPPSFGHGHADALSLVLRSGGRDLLIDPGTYTYGGDAAWRGYFRGTRAHNTVTVDRRDQADESAAFLWSRPFRTRLVLREEDPGRKIRLLACHDGYTRLKGRVRHWRGIVFRSPGSWLIWDCLTGKGEHLLELHWHLGVEPKETEAGFRFTGLPMEAVLSIEGGNVTRHRGETGPILGWRSPSYGIKEPATTIRAAYRGTLPHEFVTRIEIGGGGPVPPLVRSRDLSVLRAAMFRMFRSLASGGEPGEGGE